MMKLTMDSFPKYTNGSNNSKNHIKPSQNMDKKLSITTLFLQRTYIDEQEAHKNTFHTTSY